jgi:hypothetical protein
MAAPKCENFVILWFSHSYNESDSNNTRPQLELMIGTGDAEALYREDALRCVLP